ncbi:hypothetical protein RUM43_002510 [Polyplax serrata]|uniref:Uncharacterized protein n=1 Tax=Polyplax serrata TaxID=468196 RepID=A0AAN8NUS6_POLSC
MGDEKQEKTGKIKFLQIKRRAIKIQRKEEKGKWKSPKITVWKQEEEEEEGVVDKRRQIRKSSTSTELRVSREETSDDGSVVLLVLSQRRTSEKKMEETGPEFPPKGKFLPRMVRTGVFPKAFPISHLTFCGFSGLPAPNFKIEVKLGPSRWCPAIFVSSPREKLSSS